jgi:uroporphyrinogen-III synthase
MPERRLILTRPRAQSEAFAAALEARLPGRFAVIVSPLIEIEAVPWVPDLAGVGALAFTSANGVEQFAARTGERGLPAWCVGEMTAAAAERAGFRTCSADGDVAALAALIAGAHRDGTVLHVRGRHAAGDLVGRLAAAGVPARAAALYDQTPRPATAEAVAALAAGAAVALFSPRTARLFAAAAQADGWALGRAAAVSLSPAADAPLDGLGFGRRLVAVASTREGMLAALAGV